MENERLLEGLRTVGVVLLVGGLLIMSLTTFGLGLWFACHLVLSGEPLHGLMVGCGTCVVAGGVIEFCVYCETYRGEQ